MKKRLVLKSETVTELTAGELTGAAVGANDEFIAPTMPVLKCVSAMIVGCANFTYGCTTP